MDISSCLCSWKPLYAKYDKGGTGIGEPIKWYIYFQDRDCQYHGVKAMEANRANVEKLVNDLGDAPEST